MLTLRIRDQLGADHCLETLLTSLEARKLAHALLDANARSGREWPVSIVPAHTQDPPRSFDVQVSQRPAEQVVVTLRTWPASDRERTLGIRLAGGETYAIGHALLLAANPSRSTREDD